RAVPRRRRRSRVRRARGFRTIGGPLQDPQISNNAHGHETDVQISQPDAEQREPGEHRMPLVEPRNEAPCCVAAPGPREHIDAATADVAPRVAGKPNPPPPNTL